MSYISVNNLIQEVADKTFCCSSTCEKRFDCMNHCSNAPLRLRFPVADFSAYGSGIIVGAKVEVNYDCGALGNYKKFIGKNPGY